jgi:hypothetical protein
MKCSECLKRERQKKIKQSAYYRKWYEKNREKKIAAVKARYVPVDKRDIQYWVSKGEL